MIEIFCLKLTQTWGQVYSSQAFGSSPEPYWLTAPGSMKMKACQKLQLESHGLILANPVTYPNFKGLQIWINHSTSTSIGRSSFNLVVKRGKFKRGMFCIPAMGFKWNMKNCRISHFQDSSKTISSQYVITCIFLNNFKRWKHVGTHLVLTMFLFGGEAAQCIYIV